MPQPSPRRQNENMLPGNVSARNCRIGFIQQEIDNAVRDWFYDIVVKEDVVSNSPVLVQIGEYCALTQNMYLDYSKYLTLQSQGVKLGLNFGTRLAASIYCRRLFLTRWQDYYNAYRDLGSRTYYYQCITTGWDPDKLKGRFSSHITSKPIYEGLDFNEALYAEVTVNNQLHLNLTEMEWI